MKKSYFSALLISILLGSVPTFAEDAGQQPAPVEQQNPKAGGTLKGAAVGGVGGAVVGHPVAGAAVGGLIGHHRRHKAEKEAKKQQKAQEAAAKGNG